MSGRGHRIRSIGSTFCYSLPSPCSFVDPWTSPRHKNTLSPIHLLQLYIVSDLLFLHFSLICISCSRHAPCAMSAPHVYSMDFLLWYYVTVIPDGIEPHADKSPKGVFFESGQVRWPRSYSSKRQWRGKLTHGLFTECSPILSLVRCSSISGLCIPPRHRRLSVDHSGWGEYGDRVNCKSANLILYISIKARENNQINDQNRPKGIQTINIPTEYKRILR